MPQAATIKSLPRAFRMMKTMQAQGIEWGEDYRAAAGSALKAVLEARMRLPYGPYQLSRMLTSEQVDTAHMASANDCVPPR